MQISDVQIHTGSVSQKYKTIGTVEAKLSAATAFSPAPTIDDVNTELRQKAAKMSANAVLNVEYSRGMSLTSYKVLKAKGIAVVLESDDIQCPSCAETIKRAAKKCRFCGTELLPAL